jgi:hypothetical protein
MMITIIVIADSVFASGSKRTSSRIGGSTKAHGVVKVLACWVDT